jgi:hypothetical protein
LEGLTGINVGEGGTGEFVAVGVGVRLAVGEGVIWADSVCAGTVGVESSALTELTVNCNIGHKINVTISRIVEELVNTTPRENRVREG